MKKEQKGEFIYTMAIVGVSSAMGGVTKTLVSLTDHFCGESNWFRSLAPLAAVPSYSHLKLRPLTPTILSILPNNRHNPQITHMCLWKKSRTIL
jgi:aspartokinase